MSPKSRGRPVGRGKRGSAREQPVDLVAEVLRSATRIERETNVPDIEFWASAWLGQAWAVGAEPDEAELELCRQVVARAVARPSRAGAFAVGALRRVAPPSAWVGLDEAQKQLADQPQPQWLAEPDFRPVGAHVATDAWDSERILLIDYEPATGASESGHGLFARIVRPAGPFVAELNLVAANAADEWAKLDQAQRVITTPPVEDVLAQLAAAMFRSDLLRADGDMEYAVGRALAWSRCRQYYQPPADPAPVPQAERARLVDGFLERYAPANPEVARTIAEMFLDYSDQYRAGEALGWGPTDVRLFLHDWIPQYAIISDEERAALPDELRAWIAYVASERGVDEAAVQIAREELAGALKDFDEIYDASTSDPVKLVFAELKARGVDITDEAAVAAVVREVRASLLAGG